jgi:hypothetical protein
MLVYWIGTGTFENTAEPSQPLDFIWPTDE